MEKVINKEYEFKNIVSFEDILMARELVEYSVRTSFVAVGEERTISEGAIADTGKNAIPEPENMHLDFLMPHTRHVKNILKEDKIPLGKIAANNYYPTINKTKGAVPAQKFTNGLVKLGFGEIVEKADGKNGKTYLFKRYHPYDTEITEQKRIRAKYLWDKLNLKIDGEENGKENVSRILQELAASQLVGNPEYENVE